MMSFESEFLRSLYSRLDGWQAVYDLISLPYMDLLHQAHWVHRQSFDPHEIQISVLLSIKTGGCPENCHYCPQSAHFKTGLNKESLMDPDEVYENAQQAKNMGAERFCMGAAWRQLHDKDLPLVTEMIQKVKSLGLETCATFGMLTEKQAIALKRAGLDFYNHNLDTSPEYYGQIITTRQFDDRIKTINHISNAGINVCCGGILGMGETRSDRAKLLWSLYQLPTSPQSIPINQLIKIPGTPLENQEPIDTFEFIRTIAATRILFPASWVRLSAGRENMSDEIQAWCFFAGANSIFYGEKLLTASNPKPLKDQDLFERLDLHPAHLGFKKNGHTQQECGHQSREETP